MWSQPKAAKRIASLVFFCVLTCEFSCFQISFIIGGISTVGIHLCLECYAPARLTRVIAQASLGSPCVSVRLRVLGGWVGILLGRLRVLRNFLGRTWYNKFWKLFYRSFFACVIFRNLSLCNICKLTVMSLETLELISTFISGFFLLVSFRLAVMSLDSSLMSTYFSGCIHFHQTCGSCNF